MSKSCPSLLAPSLMILFALASHAQTPVEKIEVGAQLTSFTLFPPPLLVFQPDNVTEPGFGARFTYNLNRHVALDSEINFFPNTDVFNFLGSGRAVQGQFGVKVGKRFRKFGVFAKARPGFLSVGGVFRIEPGVTSTDSFGFPISDARIARKTYFTTDIGAVVEMYPSARMLVRFDAGDTIVRYGKHFEENFVPPEFVTVPPRLKHNFQFTAGVGWRFHTPKPTQSAGSSPRIGARETPRYEVGIQFTSISFNPPTELTALPLLPGPIQLDTELGLGGRFTYNLNRSIALEAIENFYLTQQQLSGGTGRLLQSQFGLKAGHRWRRVGVFGKVRPGLLTFTQVNQLVGTQTISTFIGPVQKGVFRVGWKSYFSLDVGGVIEHYVSRHFMTRIDVGDTIAHYDELAIPLLLPLRIPFESRPPETHHNFQFTVGVGWRF